MTNPSKNKRECIPAPTKTALDTLDYESPTDVNGSYTGRPKDRKEKPVQDADDL